MKTSENVSELLPALCKAQGSISSAKKDKTNPHLKSKYADLSSVQESCKGPLLEQGLMIIQDVNSTESSVEVTTRILHTSGQWLEVGPLSLPVVKRDPQGIGSAITYGRRYSLSAALSIITDDDDDGHSSSYQVNNQKKFSSVPTVIPEETEKTYGTLDNTQLKELTNALSFCSTEYEKSFKSNLIMHWKIDDYKNIRQIHFNGLMKSIQLHLESEKKKKQESNV